MNPDFALALLLFASSAAYAALGARLFLSKREMGSAPMGALFWIMAFWVLGGAVEMVSETFYLFSVGRTGHFIGTALLPLAALICFREYTGTHTSAHAMIVLAVIPFVSIIFAATNQYHEFMWHAPYINGAGDFLTRPNAWGPWFLFVHAPYSYGMIAVAMFILVVRSSVVPPAHRRGLYTLVAACQIPLLATVAYDFGFGPNTLSYVPFALAAMLPVYAWLIIGERLIEFAPLAYETVFQNMQDPVIVVDDHERVIGLNHVAEDMLNISEMRAMRMPLTEVLGAGSTGVFEALHTGQPQKMMTDTGRFLHVRASPINSDRSTVRGGRVLMFRDVSDVERAQSDVRKSERLLRTLIDHSVNGIVRLRRMHAQGGASLRCIFANPAAGDFLGVDSDQLLDLDAESMVRLASSGMDERDRSEVLKQIRRSLEHGTTVDRDVMHGMGLNSRCLRMIFVPAGDDLTITFIDLTDSKAKEQQMESMAWNDPLTGVLNRRGLERDASRQLSESDDDDTGALLFIDLNEFKPVNDKYGHEVGDALLRIAATRLKKSLRSCDIIGRPGGDEFVALVPNVTPEVADKLAYRLTESLEQPYVIEGVTLHCAASIGMAFYPKNASTLTGLLREADQAMYRAKERSRGMKDIHFADLLEKAL